MPISRIQSEVLRVIAASRDPESFVAGGVPINRGGPRYSADIDIFNDRVERVAIAAQADAEALEAQGFTVVLVRELRTIISANISRDGESTKLEWVSDSDFRYFPAIPDEQFGYVLAMPDLAVNKLMAAVGRREPRAVIDLLTIHDSHLPLGAIAWAAVEMSPGFTPEGLLAELRRNARYRSDDFNKLATTEPIDAGYVARRLRAAIDDAEQFVARMPSEKAGQLFFTDGKPEQPDPDNLGAYVEHTPQRRGHWPSSPEIQRTILERYLASGALGQEP